jgi:superfamily I DNA/RNA helicase
LSAALTAFSADRAVRIMSIHKSKGLEFDTVIMMGVEGETFWGKIDEERSACFVGISRAKNRLLLTVCDHRDGQRGRRDGPQYGRLTRNSLDPRRLTPSRCPQRATR